MWVDLLISAPVTLFLLWLYHYSRPRAAPGWLRVLDALVLLAAAASVVLIIALGHLRIDYPGMGLNAMLVAAAYCALLFWLGLGWGVRFRVTRRR
ncbi:MAG: hypothetical protein Kow0020_11990 [Wenzhouxiangellaceae bacterium]